MVLPAVQDLQREVNDFCLPDLEAEYTDEEGDCLDAALDKYNEIRQALAETQVSKHHDGDRITSMCQARAETMCVCWNKLDQDVSELTAAITSGGGSKVTMERLEESIRTLKEMFIERKGSIEVRRTGRRMTLLCRRFTVNLFQATEPTVTDLREGERDI